jgi:2-C-methyl-D-erythritol 4-phosphate cytidylyltransferase
METSKPKQFIFLGGKPLLAHTVSRFEGCESVDEIIVVLPRDGFEEHAESMVRWISGLKPVKMVPGGEERQDSVAAALDRLPSSYDGFVAVHDGARPLVNRQIIQEVIEAAKRYGGALAAMPVYETLKEVEEGGVVIGTLNRRLFYRAQTPQCFRYGVLRAAMDKACSEGYLGTDEAALVERMGVKVHVVPGSETNIKVTTEKDLALAEYYLKKEFEK